jgi:hypothetical protein
METSIHKKIKRILTEGLKVDGWDVKQGDGADIHAVDKKRGEVMVDIANTQVRKWFVLDYNREPDELHRPDGVGEEFYAYRRVTKTNSGSFLTSIPRLFAQELGIGDAGGHLAFRLMQLKNSKSKVLLVTRPEGA